jgi:outer membrane protein assembly factor BamB
MGKKQLSGNDPFARIPEATMELARLKRHVQPISVMAVVGMISWPLAASAENWPGWRGPRGDGVSAERDLPLRWSRTEHIRWKTALPGPGNSSPVVWADRHLLTQALDKGKRRAVLCFARSDGKLLWQKETPFSDKESTHETNPFCSATPVTDGERVVASLGSAGMVCYDLDGNELWHHPLGKLEHVWGNASSPILYDDMAILWCGPGQRQFLLAVNKRTGQTVWQHEEPGGKGEETRPYIGSWSTPLVLRVNGQDELILSAAEWLKGFDPKSGKELWSCAGLHNADGDQLAYCSPVADDAIVVAVGGYGSGAMAVRAGGHGEVTKTHRLWYQPRGNPQRISSPVIAQGHVFLINEKGLAQCFDLSTGEDFWNKTRIEGNIWGSLVAAGNRLYVTSMAGDTFVLAADPKFKLLAKNSLGERVLASPALSNGEIFIRSYQHLWCIGR